MKTEDIKTLVAEVEKAFPGLEIFTFAFDIQFGTLYVQTLDRAYFDSVAAPEETTPYEECVFHTKTVGLAQVIYLERAADVA